jgi:hypothetical protein
VETLRYSQDKLTLRILGAAGGCAGAIYLFAHPDVADMLPFPLDSFGGEIGHYIVSPITIAVSAVLGWLAAARLIGGRAAVECLPEELRVTTFWGRTRIRWADLGHVYLVRKRRHLLFVRHQLVFHFVGKGVFGTKRLRLPVDATELPRDRFEAFREGILACKRGAAHGRVAVSRPSGEGAAGEGFDPDAAIARYLARKAQEQSEAPTAVPVPVPLKARPVFGRRVV